MKRVVFFLLIVLCTLAMHATVYAAKPSILIDSWGETPDLTYMKELQAAGFEVEAIPHEKLNWELLKQYNVLILVDFPQEGTVTRNPSHGPASGPNLQETLALVDKFLASGGGVMFNLLQHGTHEIDLSGVEFHNAAEKALERWGARLPLEKLDLTPEKSVQHDRLGMSFFYTENVEKSPVSDKVRGVWYPATGYWGVAGPIEVDENWQVVLRAPKGTRSTPLKIVGESPGMPYFEKPFVRTQGVEAPPLFAVRQQGPGRVALFHAAPNFHWGSGRSWAFNGVMLDKGLNDKPSDFGQLLLNTFRWLAEPSFAGGQLGGAVTPPERWTRPLEKAGVFESFAVKNTNLDPALQPKTVNLYKGIIGVQTAFSGGAGTVEEYAATARAKGLSFIVFLEDMAELTSEELAELTKLCAANSGDDLLLIPGYRITSNLGNQFFLCGLQPQLLHDKYLSADRKTFMIQPPAEEAGHYKESEFVKFVFEFSHNNINTLGWFNFNEPMKKGGMALHDLRLFSMAGLLYYKDGKLIEDVTDQYLLTNAGTMTGTPVAINLMDSPGEVANAAETAQGLTYTTSNSVKTLWMDSLRWNNTYDTFNTFASTGPMIKHWPQGMYRTGTYAAEPYVAGRMLVTPFLQVSSEAGLKEVSIYDGETLFRRFLPQRAKEFTTRFFLSGSLQRNMSVVATDVKGGKAVSFPLRGWNDGSPAAVYCSDHVNDCIAMKSFRGGPLWSRYSAMPLVPEAGLLWDGMGGIAQRVLFGWGELRPAFTTTDGVQGPIFQTPVMEFCDDKVWRGSHMTRGVLTPGSVHRNPWSNFGPILPTPLVEMKATFTEWAQYNTGVATSYGPLGIAEGPTATLFTHSNTFNKDTTLKGAQLAEAWRQKSPFNAEVTLVLGRGDTILESRAANPTGPSETPGHFSWRIERGDWLATISPDMSNSTLYVNYGVPLRLNAGPEVARLYEDVPAEGIAVKKGESRKVEWFMGAWPLDNSITDTASLLRWIRYFQQPDGMEILRGRRTSELPGVIELAADNFAAEVKVPRAADKLDANLPLRVSGFNPRWSAVLWQKEGHVGAGRYGKPQNRYRNLGVDSEGRIYFPVYSGQAALHHLVAGQPIVADKAGEALFINVVCLKDAEENRSPLWHVSVNNPTDQAITAKLTRTIALPGLEFADSTVTLQPGEQRILAHP